jgi:hypothetical protein
VACVKKTKNGYVNNNVGAPKFVFFTEATKNVLFTRNFVNEHKMCGFISRYIFFKILNIFKYVFFIMGASTPMSQSGFLQILLVLINLIFMYFRGLMHLNPLTSYSLLY